MMTLAAPQDFDPDTATTVSLITAAHTNGNLIHGPERESFADRHQPTQRYSAVAHLSPSYRSSIGQRRGADRWFTSRCGRRYGRTFP